MSKFRGLKASIPFVVGAAIMAVPPVMHQALADAASEVVNAQTHAGLAAAATKIEGVHTHLHHALNCLVGPAGQGFDAKQMNPCAQAGSGAIPDTTDAAKKKKLEAAAAKAREGIAATDFAAAQKAASETASMLTADE
ncbi:MAG TPA: hypothetical protein VHD95_02685 [Rhizomicrobium sp.]|jgi:hypothetical protein|nr:hypothetical protein [Rhizomicrobium sp.]